MARADFYNEFFYIFQCVSFMMSLYSVALGPPQEDSKKFLMMSLYSCLFYGVSISIVSFQIV